MLASVESAMAFLGSVLWPYIYSLFVKFNVKPGVCYIVMGVLASILLPLLMYVCVCVAYS